MVPKTGELHRHAFVNELIGRKWELVIFAITARVIELGSQASYTLRARSPPQHRSLGNVPGICNFERADLLQIYSSDRYFQLFQPDL